MPVRVAQAMDSDRSIWAVQKKYPGAKHTPQKGVELRSPLEEHSAWPLRASGRDDFDRLEEPQVMITAM